MSIHTTIMLISCILIIFGFIFVYSAPIDGNGTAVIGTDGQIVPDITETSDPMDGTAPFDDVLGKHFLDDGAVVDENVKDLLGDIATEEANDTVPFLNAKNLTNALVAEARKFNFSMNIFNPTAPGYNASVALKLIDVLTEGIRVLACEEHKIEEVGCPEKDEENGCHYQIFTPLDGYGGLACRTQCIAMSCKDVPKDEEEELEAEADGTAIQENTVGETEAEKNLINTINTMKLEHTEPIMLAMAYLKDHMKMDGNETVVDKSVGLVETELEDAIDS
ncbi:uncharacterized protein [Mytilus edulis]|uniref:uncharacterized protein n=1 Tax=Mytilus edulis TaxID=6550 RepID=UPI0039F14D87